jgi:hypothetical protein
MSNFLELSIANLSQLTEDENFLLQISKKSERLSDFIKNDIPKSEKSWLADLKTWQFSNTWIKSISDICLEEYDQVFFDYGTLLLDLKDPKNYEEFKSKILNKKILD